MRAPNHVTHWCPGGLPMPADTPDYATYPEDCGGLAHETSWALDRLIRAEGVHAGYATTTDLLSDAVTSWVANNDGVRRWRERCGIDQDAWDVLAPLIRVEDIPVCRTVPVVVGCDVAAIAAADGLGPWWADPTLDGATVQAAFDAYGQQFAQVIESGTWIEGTDWPWGSAQVTAQVDSRRGDHPDRTITNPDPRDLFSHTIWCATRAVLGPFPTHTLTEWRAA